MKWLSLLFVPLLAFAQLGLRDPAFIASGSALFGPASYDGLLAWWDADSLTYTNNTPIGETGVTPWPDRSGNGNTLANQPTPAARPLFKTNIFNGRSILRFSGAQVLGLTTAITFSNNFTVVAVMSINADSLLFGSSTANRQVRWQTTTLSFYDGVAGGSSSALSTTVSNRAMVVWRASGVTLGFRENTASRNGAASTINLNTTVDLMGVTSPFSFAIINGDVAEVLIYNRVRTDAECDNLYNNYFKPKWGLP